MTPLSNPGIKCLQCVFLLGISPFLFRSSLDAGMEHFFRPTSIDSIWSETAMFVGLLIVPTACLLFTQKRLVTLVAIILATVAFSLYGAQILLRAVAAASDQTYLIDKSYLTEHSALLPFLICATALAISFMRLKTYSCIQE